MPKKNPSDKTKKSSSKAKKPARAQVQVQETVKKSLRPADEVVTYQEIEYQLAEIPAQGNKV
ncbi:MAG TPA: hypothetical protein VH621_03085, partial [Nitrososphaera sp.]